MAVMLRRRNTGSSCQNTQGAVITASLPDTGTQNYNARVLTPVCSVAVPSEQHSHQTGRMALSSFSALWQWQGTSWGAQGTASGELRALGSELREILQSDTVTSYPWYIFLLACSTFLMGWGTLFRYAVGETKDSQVLQYIKNHLEGLLFI